MSELRKRGLVTAVVCSDPFIRLGKTQAMVLGTPDLPLVIVPHPVGGLALDKVRERAQVAVPQVVKLIEEQVQ